MFKILDGRDCFYQWDTNRQIKVGDSTINELHFCNKTDDCSLVVEVVDGVANVPNVLLQTDWDIRVYGFSADYTKIEKRFKVIARTKPADYVYTETEIKSYDELAEQLLEIRMRVAQVGDGASIAYQTARNAQQTADTAQQTALNAGQMAYQSKITLDNVIEPNLASHEERLDAMEFSMGDMETALKTIMDIQGNLIGTITFTCKELGGNVSYTAIKGMTWDEWCNSPYDTKEKYSIDGNNVIYTFGTASGPRAVGTNTAPPTKVLPTDKITDGATYNCNLAV